MLWVGFEPTIPVFQGAKTLYALDGAAIVIDTSASCTVTTLEFLSLFFFANCVVMGHVAVSESLQTCEKYRSTILWEVMPRRLTEFSRCCGERHWLHLQGRSTSQVLIQKDSTLHNHPYSNLKSDSGSTGVEFLTSYWVIGSKYFLGSPNKILVMR
jgi:hypothetical protein